MSQLTSLFLSPYNFLFGEDGIFAPSEGNRKKNNNSQALLMGLPAIIFAVLGLLFLLVGEFSAGKALVRQYEDKVAEIRKEKADLSSRLNQELKMANATQQGSQGNPEISSLREQLTDELDSEQILLNKLYSLEPEEPKHLYELALTYLTKSNLINLSSAENKQALSVGERNKCFSIMKRIAPLEKPGLLDAHIFLAKDALGSKVQSANEGIGSLRLASAHLNNALVRDQQNTTALGLKVLIANQTRQPEEAKASLEKLFVTDPFVYPQLCNVNSQLGLSDNNLAILHSAQQRLAGEIGRMSGASDRRTRFMTYLVDCLHRLENLDEADRRVRAEMEEFPTNAGIQRWGKRLLSIGQQLRFQSAGEITEKNMDKLIGYLREGHRLDPNNQKILDFIVELRRHDLPGIDKISQDIYRPGPRAPASVDNLLGTIALKKNDYLEAVKHFAKANKKDPNNVEYLNNLSYVYLTRPDPDPREALKMVDIAIRSVRSKALSTRYLTHFFDTQGRALLALGKIAEEKGDKNLAESRYSAAAAKLLKALVDRPDNLEIMEAVVESYQAAGQPEQVRVWSERVKQLKASKKKDEGPDKNQ